MKKKWMGELETIMEQKDPNVRRQKLNELAIHMGVSVAAIATANGVIEENLIIERIEQRILLHNRERIIEKENLDLISLRYRHEGGGVFDEEGVKLVIPHYLLRFL
ncbi:MAG: hypothetical protein OEY64_07555 [Nitrospinota bacterium]|nr:hypothetical protein [Nitrospinota bacterium]